MAEQFLAYLLHALLHLLYLRSPEHGRPVAILNHPLSIHIIIKPLVDILYSVVDIDGASYRIGT